MAQDYETELDRCEEEISSIDMAIDMLHGVRGAEDVIEELRGRKNALAEEAEGYHREVEAEREAEDRALNREYERDLL